MKSLSNQGQAHILMFFLATYLPTLSDQAHTMQLRQPILFT